MKVASELLTALRALTATARTFRNVPLGQQEWTSIDDEALNAAFAAIARADSEGLDTPPPAPTLAVALDVLATWVKQAEQRIADLEGNSSTGDIDYSELAERLDMDELASSVDMDRLAYRLDLSDLASNVSLSDLASEFDLSDLAEDVAGHLDMDDAITDTVNDALRNRRFRLE